MCVCVCACASVCMCVCVYVECCGHIETREAPRSKEDADLISRVPRVRAVTLLGVAATLATVVLCRMVVLESRLFPPFMKLLQVRKKSRCVTCSHCCGTAHCGATATQTASAPRPVPVSLPL